MSIISDCLVSSLHIPFMTDPRLLDSKNTMPKKPCNYHPILSSSRRLRFVIFTVTMFFFMSHTVHTPIPQSLGNFVAHSPFSDLLNKSNFCFLSVQFLYTFTPFYFGSTMLTVTLTQQTNSIT